VVIGLAAVALAFGGFQAGRYTVDAAAVANPTASIPRPSASDPASHREKLLERVQDKITVRDIATVPFSELDGEVSCLSSNARSATHTYSERHLPGQTSFVIST
jgi:hypothetical protein